MHANTVIAAVVIFTGVAMMINTVQETIRWFARNPVWSLQNWRTLRNGLIGWFVVAFLLIVGGTIGLIVTLSALRPP